MKFFIVGSPEPLFERDFVSSQLLKARQFSEDDFLNNLKKLDHLRLFDSFEQACDYARSLRVQLRTKAAHPAARKIAPVLQVNFTGDCSKYHADAQVMANVYFREYKNIEVNYCTRDDKNRDIVHAVVVSFYACSKAEINLSEFQLISATFPDVDYPELHFQSTSQTCILL